MKQTTNATALLLVFLGCRGGNAPEARPAAGPESAANVESVGSTASVDGGAKESAQDDGMPRLAVVLDDSRLLAARDRARAHDSAGAAGVLDAVGAQVSLDPSQACAWAYTSGRLHWEAGENKEALASFERVLALGDDAGVPCRLRPYAALRAGEALVRLGRPDDAIARLRTVGDDIAARDETKLALADASASKGDRAAAVELWRALLTASPHGVRWADTSLQLGTAILDGVDGPAEAHAQEALDLATRVLIEAPSVAEHADVAGLRVRAAALLKRPGAPLLTPDERARQAQAWLDAGQPKRATETGSALLKALAKDDKKHREAACKAAIVCAQAVPRGKSDRAADAWGEAIARCEGEDAQVTALYYGGKASASAHRQVEATSRFALVEHRFPRHRFADDARFHAALVAYDAGDEAAYVAMLASIPDAYPNGDMKGEALVRVALAKLAQHDVQAASAALDRALAVAGDDPAAASAGRAAYYRARVAQLAGDLDDAKRRYTALVAGQPFAFAMLLAHARLNALDAAAARAAIQTAVSHEPPGPLLTREHEELSSPAFERFARLLEVGEIDAARREAMGGGLVGDGVDAEVLWAVAWAYDRAGAPELGHGLARSRLVDYRIHWPAGRWRLAWQLAYPRPWEDVVAAESASAGIETALTWAIMREESAFNPEAHSAANAIGLMQLLGGTARLVARGTALPFDDAALRRPEVSIALGARLLGSLRTSFPDNPSLAIAAYNGGTGNVRRWLAERGGDDFDVFVDRIPFDETRNYLKRVLSSEAAYAYLYAPKALDELFALPQRASGQPMVASP
jgi:soluble lytic murein transglycosylase